jgi:antagonist of KipI
MGSIRVVRSGLLTTVQDAGRYGHQRHGVIAGGAVDPFAPRVANLLVGNGESEAILEIILLGPELRFEQNSWIAFGGGGFRPQVRGRAVRDWRPVWVRAGESLAFGAAVEGCRAYLAVAGGFDLPAVMGSRGTTLRAGYGGFHGRALRDGDLLPLRISDSLPAWLDGFRSRIPEGDCFWEADWSVGVEVLPDYGQHPVIRAVRGGEWDRFTPESREAFFSSDYQITPRSDRMGYRLSGPRLELSDPFEMLSEAVAPGTVQVTPEGDPILLLADAPTTGGYPKIAHAASVDLPILAQAKPGGHVRFREVTVREAQDHYRQRERQIWLVRQGLALHGR